ERRKFDTIYSVLKNDWYYSDSVKDLDEELTENAINGMTQLEQDSHTNYFDLESAQQFASELEGSNVGLGFSYYKDDQGDVLIREVFMNSAAYEAGLQAGDTLVRLDDKRCRDLSEEELVSYIQSREGENIDLVYVRQGEEIKTKGVPSSYDTSVALRLLDQAGYISVNSFSEQTGTEFADAMQEIKKAGKESLILDLRGNSGGYLYSTLEVASSLLPADSVVFVEQTKDQKKAEKRTTDDFSPVKMKKIVILQNGKTASASEALIGALKENLKDSVVTVGTTTYGKGTEQTQVSFPDGTSLKYTIAQWLTPSSKSIHLKGFKPDIKIKTEAFRSVGYRDFEEGEVIKKDTVHENAEALQVYLKYLGYEVDRTDEYFSIQSARALAQFQQEHKLPATGDCDETCWDTLQGALMKKMNEQGLNGDRQIQKALDQC
ncbi:MAG: peptidoglycan-binding protein, partial [Erysipelotrichaceae bacterium]|nr:peptidoglycan-binding protein [Erysipelotrichaceae bacterium]